MANTQTIGCPSGDELADFVQGRSPAARLEEIAAHLEQCPACSAALERAAGQETITDLATLPMHARRPVAADAVWDEPECQEMLAAAKALPEAPRNWSASLGARPLPPSLGQYELLERIGAGGMGVVYKARHKRLERIVALKIIAEHRVADAQSLERFVREWVALAKFKNEHIVGAIDACEDQGFHFLVMEYVEGIDLAALVRRGGRLSVPDACEAIRQAALGLEYVAKHKTVHRDIKPSNLMLAADGTVKILDLGLALRQQDDSARSGLTSDQQILGTVDFMAPEQALDSHAVDIRGDIYSLGCTLYYLLTGQAPFGSSDGYSGTMKKLLAHSQAPRPAICKLRPDVPPRLDALVRRMMAKSPSDRAATAAKLAAELGQFTVGSNLLSLLRSPADPIRTVPANSIVSAGRLRRTAIALPRGRRLFISAICAVALFSAALFALKKFAPTGGSSTSPFPQMPLDTDSYAGPWQSLLGGAPTPIYFDESGGVSWWKYDAARGTVRFNSTGECLLQIGQRGDKNYEIDAAFESPWTGIIGIFWGCHPTKDDGWRFQTIFIQLVQGAVPGEQKANVSRRLSVLGAGKQPSQFALLSTSSVAIPEEMPTHRLRLVVRDRRLADVWFDDAELSGLTKDDAPAQQVGALQPQREDSVGGFGLYATGGAGSFIGARMRKLDSATTVRIPNESVLVELPVPRNSANVLHHGDQNLAYVQGGNAFDRDGELAIAVAARMYAPNSAPPRTPPLDDPLLRVAPVSSDGHFKFDRMKTLVPAAQAVKGAPGAENFLVLWPQYNDKSWGLPSSILFYARQSSQAADCGAIVDAPP